MQTSIMLRHLVIASLLILGADVLLAQQSTAPAPDTIKLPAGTLPYDPAKFAEAVGGSYYHADQLTGLNCDLSINWQKLFEALKQTPSPERLKTLQGLKVSSRAARGKATELTFDWTGGPLDSKERMEDALKQMVGGFYQMYWSMMTSTPIEKPSEIQRFEPQPDGGVIVYLASQSSKVDMTVDKEHLPIHYKLDTPALKALIDLHYVPSPSPAPGDLHRLSSLDESVQFGTSTMNVQVSLDYQTVDGLYVPKHAAVQLVGAYSIGMEFSGCSTTTKTHVSEPK